MRTDANEEAASEQRRQNESSGPCSSSSMSDSPSRWPRHRTLLTVIVPARIAQHSCVRVDFSPSALVFFGGLTRCKSCLYHRTSLTWDTVGGATVELPMPVVAGGGESPGRCRAEFFLQVSARLAEQAVCQTKVTTRWGEWRLQGYRETAKPMA
ncbi:hypothetical protein VUR80DRAFT_7620 [Thermomyces stellatus]